MAMLKKGSRQIAVGGCHYRWRMRHRPTYWQEIFEAPMMFVVQAANGKGAKLFVFLPQAHPFNINELKPSPVTPALVEEHIRRGLASGWNPQQPGKAFILGERGSIRFNEKAVFNCPRASD